MVIGNINLPLPFENENIRVIMESKKWRVFSIYQILPQLIDLWGINLKTTVPARKN